MKVKRLRLKELRQEVLRLKELPEYQHSGSGDRPRAWTCPSGDPNRTKIAGAVGCTRARVQQILKEERELELAKLVQQVRVHLDGRGLDHSRITDREISVRMDVMGDPTSEAVAEELARLFLLEDQEAEARWAGRS